MNKKRSEQDILAHKEAVDKSPNVDLARRAIIIGGASLMAGMALEGCRSTTTKPTGRSNRNIGIDGRDYSAQPPQGSAREFSIEARLAEVEIAPNRLVKAWTYDGKLPGTEIRVKEGERVRIRLQNSLPQDTSIHWHGLPQRGTNNMDGVPGVTQDPIKPGQTFVYDFLASPAGTFFFHPHTGLQLDRGLYAPLIIEPKNESLQYDREYLFVIDDWLNTSPDDAYAKLKRGEAQEENEMPGMEGGQMSEEEEIKSKGASGGGKKGAGSKEMPMEEGADVDYATFLVNGRAPAAAQDFEARRGDRVRLRLINASGSTIYRVAVAGHPMTVTHADGMMVQAVEIDTLEIAPGERYDVMVTANNPGVWPIVALSTDEPKRGGHATLRYIDAQASSAPTASHLPKELKGRLLSYAQLLPGEGLPVLPPRAPDRQMEIRLGGQMLPYTWTINGKLFPDAEPFELRAGELVRARMINDTMMRHPMHLHGHSFHLLANVAQGGQAPLKDTVIVEPNKAETEFEFVADNPGDWLFHCHHAYHLAAGMSRIFKYI